MSNGGAMPKVNIKIDQELWDMFNELRTIIKDNPYLQDEMKIKIQGLKRMYLRLVWIT
jgi:hypothetical protein